MKVKLLKNRGQLTAGSVVDYSEAEAQDAIRAGEAAELNSAEAIEALANENKALKAKQEEQRKTFAESKVNAMINSGKIAAKDTATIDKWRTRFASEQAADWVEAAEQLPGKDLTGRATPVQTSEPRQAAPVKAGEVEVGAMGTTESIKAYAAKLRDARGVHWTAKEADGARRDAGRIFASELDPIIAKGGDFALRAVNAEGEDPIQATNVLAGSLILQRSLILLKQRLDWLSKCGTNFSAEGAKYGQPIYTRIRGVPTVDDYNTSTGWPTNRAVAPTDKIVTLDAHKGVLVSYDTQTLGSTVRNLFQEQSEPMAYALAKAIADKVAALFTPTNYTNTPVSKALSEFNRLTVLAVKDSLDTANNPDFDRILMLSTQYGNKLLEDIQVVAPLYGGVGGVSAIAAKNVHGFDLYPSQSFNSLSNSVVGVGMGSSAVLVAARLPQDYTQVFPDLPSTATVEVITEPGSGLSLQMVRYVNHTLANANMRVALMYGAAVGQAEAATLVTS